LKRYNNIVLLLCLFSSTRFFSQNIDSLKLALEAASQDTLRCELLLQLSENAPDGEWEKYTEELRLFCEKKLKTLSSSDKQVNTIKHYYAAALNNSGMIHYGHGEFDKALEYYEASLKVLEETGDKSGMATTFLNTGAIYQTVGKIQKSLEYYFKSLELQEETGDKQGSGYSLSNIGDVFRSQGDITKALEYYSKSLKIREEIGDKSGIAASYNNIGFIYQSQGDLPKALEYYNNSAKIAEEMGNNHGLSRTLLNIGYIYSAAKDYSKALEYYFKGLKLQEQIGDKKGCATSLNNIGAVYQNMGDDNKSLEFLFKGLKLREELADQEGIAFSLGNIGSLYFRQKKLREALDFAKRSMFAAEDLGYPENIKNGAELLYDIYSATGNYQLAMENYELYIKMRDSITNDQTKKAAIRNQLKYEYEKQAAKDSIRNAEKIVQESIKHEEAIKQQRLYTYGGALGFGLMLVIAGISFRAYQNKQKANEIISLQKKLVEEQKHLVEEKQREVLDSIYYARRIQRALITNENYISKNLKKHKN
jgi:tetratricopeptide (TPR) repeat protein